MPTLDSRHDPIEKNVISNEPLEITFFILSYFFSFCLFPWIDLLIRRYDFDLL